MNRIIVVTILLLITSCQVLKKKGGSKRQHDNLAIHANTSISQNPIKGLRIKTKINVFRDSIVVSASPALGIEVFQLKITNDKIYIDNKANKVVIDVIKVLDNVSLIEIFVNS